MNKIFTAKEFIARLKNVAAMKTIYINGGWGVRLTEAQKRFFTTNSASLPLNRRSDRISAIQKVTNDTWGFDCVCFVKAVLWGFTGDLTQEHGGAAYASNGVPDTTISILLNGYCDGKSADMGKVEAGEFLSYNGQHCGIYLGDGKVIQANLTGEHDGVYITDYDPNAWTSHGKLCWIDYPKTARFICPCCGTEFEVKEV